MWLVAVRCLALPLVVQTVLAQNDERTTAKNTFKMAWKQAEVA
jgi:hypothetical protein